MTPRDSKSTTTSKASTGAEQLNERSRFLTDLEPFNGLSKLELERVARSIVERVATAGEAVLVESGLPGTELYVVRDGTLELLHKDAVVALITRGEVFGHPTLLTGLPPEFTTRARSESLLYCIPKDVAIALLSHPEGLMWLAGNQRERLIQAARTMRALPDVRNRPVTSLVRSEPLFCEPDTTIREAARMLAEAGRSALLVRLRDGLGIVTDVDFRDKVVLSGASRDAPVSSIMTTPVHTIGAQVLAPEASIAMMASGVNHLPVLDAEGAVIGILSASNLMTLDARSPFALRRSLQTADSQDDMARHAADVPHLFVDLLDAHLDAPALMRVLTVLADAMTSRLLELSIDAHGAPPVPFAWLAFGSSARSELTLASDQDNGLAYADTDDPAVDEYFRVVADEVNEGLQRCGFALDPHGVLARYREWRMTLSAWRGVFADCLEGRDIERLARASVAFDFRQVAGELYIDLVLTDIMREAPAHKGFMRGLAQLGTRTRLPLGFRQRLEGSIDIKKHGLVPIQNLARYYAFSRGISAHSTVERLIAVRESDGEETVAERSLREAYTSMAHLQLRHHANAIRHGRTLDNVIDTATLRPLTKVTLQEAMREVAAVQSRFPRLAAALR
jgi:CBS domain-containing protein